MSENKSQKFIRLAEMRVNRTIDNIRLVGNLANKSQYNYTEIEAECILSALENKVADLRNKFYPKKTEEIQNIFRFSDVIEQSEDIPNGGA